MTDKTENSLMTSGSCLIQGQSLPLKWRSCFLPFVPDKLFLATQLFINMKCNYEAESAETIMTRRVISGKSKFFLIVKQ